MRKILIVLSSFCSVALGATPEDMTKEVFKNDKGKLPYRAISVGKSDRKPALVVFLHGMGERGSDNEAQLKHGVEDLLLWLKKSGKRATVIVPQCDEAETWASLEGNFRVAGQARFKEEPTPSMALLLALIERYVANGEVDPGRIYITGLSMGGFGTFDAVARKPELFAAAIPICGAGDPKAAGRMKNVPFWIFHGEDDRVVPVECSQIMVGALIGNLNQVRYSQYVDVGHNSWTPAYRNPNVWKWLFSHTRKR